MCVWRGVGGVAWCGVCGVCVCVCIVVVVGGGGGDGGGDGGGGAGVVMLVLAASVRRGEVQRPGYWEEHLSPGWHWEQAGPVTYI